MYVRKVISKCVSKVFSWLFYFFTIKNVTSILSYFKGKVLMFFQSLLSDNKNYWDSALGGIVTGWITLGGMHEPSVAQVIGTVKVDRLKTSWTEFLRRIAEMT